MPICHIFSWSSSCELPRVRGVNGHTHTHILHSPNFWSFVHTVLCDTSRHHITIDTACMVPVPTWLKRVAFLDKTSLAQQWSSVVDERKGRYAQHMRTQTTDIARQLFTVEVSNAIRLRERRVTQSQQVVASHLTSTLDNERYSVTIIGSPSRTKRYRLRDKQKWSYYSDYGFKKSSRCSV